MSETCRVLFQNKFEKLVHLVGFIIRRRKLLGLVFHRYGLYFTTQININKRSIIFISFYYRRRLFPWYIYILPFYCVICAFQCTMSADCITGVRAHTLIVCRQHCWDNARSVLHTTRSSQNFLRMAQELTGWTGLPRGYSWFPDEAFRFLSDNCRC